MGQSQTGVNVRILDVVLNEDGRSIYAIGDSHAVAIAQAGQFINKASNGRSAFDVANTSAVEEVAPGSTVVFSAGTNDINRQNVGAVIMRIEKLLYQLKKKNCVIYFVLPAQTDSTVFIGDKNLLRSELANQLPGDIPGLRMLDLGTLSVKDKGSDGIHAPSGWYADAANKVKSAHGPVATAPAPAAAKPPADQTKPTADAGAGQSSSEFAKNDERRIDKPETPAGSSGKQATPTLTVPKDRVGEDVRAIQQALIDAGYDVGKHGADAKFGPDTQEAIKRFQKDHGIEPGGFPGPKTIDALQKAPKVSNPAANKPAGSSGKVAPQNRVKNVIDWHQVSDYLKTKGLSDNHRAGILANIEAESGFNAGDTTGDRGTSWGLLQWQGSRRIEMIKFAGNDWKTNWQKQMDFALSEREGQQYLSKKFNTPGEAAYWFCWYFERPKEKKAESEKRSAIAKNYL